MAHIVDERGYNQIYARTAAQQFRLHRRAKAIVAEMKLPASAGPRAGLRLLEIGCGTGELAAHIASLTEARVTGVDISSKFIAEASAAHKHENLDFAVADLTRPPPESETGKYQWIVGNGILHHLYPRLDAVLPALARWLAPGGRLIFWEPNLHNPYVFLIFSFRRLRRRARLEPGEMAFTRGFIARQLTQAGFADVKVDRRDFLLPNAPRCLVQPLARVGDWLEKLPGFPLIAQSLFIVAGRPAQDKGRASDAGTS